VGTVRPQSQSVRRQDKPSTNGKGKGNPWLASTLGEITAVLARSNTFLGERYRRLSRRHGKLRAIAAMSNSVLPVVWHLLADSEAHYNDLEPGRGGDGRRRGPHVAQRNEEPAQGVAVDTGPHLGAGVVVADTQHVARSLAIGHFVDTYAVSHATWSSNQRVKGDFGPGPRRLGHHRLVLGQRACGACAIRNALMTPTSRPHHTRGPSP
jgi:hypothetical protein